MKSIVEEASSVVKAIEKGWLEAGKPSEFSVKVFEIEQKNFLGMTTKSAKIAIFFGDKLVHEKNITRTESPEKRTLQAQQQSQPKKEFKPVVKKQQPTEPTYKQTAPSRSEDKKEYQARETWTNDMVKVTQSWLKETLRLMNLSNKNFTVEVKNYYLKINFDQPLFENSERERLLFRSLAHLIMQSLRNKFKKGFRGFKIILNSEKTV